MIHKLNKFMSDALFSQDTEVLVDAMRYSVLSPGKRLRGLMLMEIVNDFEVNIQKALPAAASIEFLHAYSLVHDDLPSIDNDDMRRGMLSCHKKYGEATAILTGNALLTLAFQMLCYYKSRCATIVEILSKSVGYKGMLKGQIQDIKSNSLDDDAKEANIDSIVYIHKLKTGNLFGAACKIGALIGGANSIELAYYKSFGENFGIAFQIADDFEDAASTNYKDINNMVCMHGSNITKQIGFQFIDAAFTDLSKMSQKSKFLNKSLKTIKGKIDDAYNAIMHLYN